MRVPHPSRAFCERVGILNFATSELKTRVPHFSRVSCARSADLAV
jgi:hypothetical protein